MKQQILNIDNDLEIEQIKKIGVALASPIRVNIMRQINIEGKTISELAKLNNVSFSSILFHIKLLEDANLVRITTIRNNNNFSKYVIKGCLRVLLHFEDPIYPIGKTTKIFKQSMPVGLYSSASLGDNNGFFYEGEFHSFYSNTPFRPDRFKASLVYSNKGFLEYNFDNSEVKEKVIKEISFTVEICSEVPYYNNNFESLIGFSINKIEILDFVSPGDFGGRKGKQNPDTVSPNSTQYGQLKTITVSKDGVFFDGILIKDNITIDNLDINKNNCVSFKITSKERNGSYGGFNVFGKEYGDYPQDIEMSITYEE